MLQAALRAWPPAVVHDTVAAVVHSAAFRKSLQTTLAQRFFRWLLDGLDAVMDFLRGSAPARWAAMAFGVLLVLLIVGRFLLAARARDDDMAAGEGRRGGRTAEDPWRAADALLAAGRLEEAAHALYRGVVESVTRTEKIRLDASKTSGDYVRELRSRGSARTSSFRDFARRFDVAVYGHGGCDAVALRDLARLAEPFRPERARGVRAA